MCVPLAAEGEFVLVSEHLEAIGKKPALMRGQLVTDNTLNFMRADLAGLQRNETDLRRYAPVALETAVRDGHMLFKASAQRALGVLHRLTGDYEKSGEHLRQALQIFEDMETRWQVGRTLVEMAELAAAQDDCAQARDLYLAAIDAFEEMGARPDLERAQAALAALQ